MTRNTEGKNEYLGYKEIIFTDEEAQALFGNDVRNAYGLLPNEYLVAYDTAGGIIGKFRCTGDGEMLEPVQYQTISSRHMGVLKPRNVQQELAIDMLRRDDITVKILTGRYGTGKDFLSISAAMEKLERGVVEKIVLVRNNIEVKGTRPIGYLPGDSREKMLPWCGPIMDHVGGEEGLNRMLDEGKLEVAHLGFIRGRDIRNAIIYSTEAENLITQHVQLLLGRVSEGSQLWLNGDFKQADMEMFVKDSGLMTAVDKLKGHPLFGYVMLQKTERSETAAMADLLD